MRVNRQQPLQTAKRILEVTFECPQCKGKANVKVAIQGPVVQLPDGFHCTQCEHFPLMKRGQPVEKAPPRIVSPEMMVPGDVGRRS